VRYWVRCPKGFWYGPFVPLWEAESVAREVGGQVREVSPLTGVRAVD
jgi:hypothetical protein